ncbi:biotin/lipoyl-binding protein [uncultured Phascolarctobacterium sp.]|uniref:HlyD family efflux transporter periplasmic adaptor subunit n=1 Tax=uncultured Phascolarctobacterium sp. TaxID=512296 RepID=UPI002614685A|nr:biotin/lipoyl-binding protein [uncultured Phascolarctobacterium sp.]
MANNELFSKEAMDKLRSPEKLDTLLEVTTPIGWMALAAMVVMVLSVLVWSVFGAMVVKVDGVGILLDSGGVVSVTSVSGGRVEDVFVRTGMRVQKGDLIAVLEQPQQSMETKLARSDMYLSESEREALTRASQYDAKRYQQDVSSFIFSEADGIVDEVSTSPGAVVAAGTSVCTIRKDQERDEINGVLYVPVSNGKRIEPGMTVQLAPNGVDSSEDGSLLAVVRSVSQYPVSANAMLNRLGNQQLVQWILSKSDNAVMEVNFDLVKDENSESGYLWTSIVGRHKPVTAGSICAGSVIVDRKQPLEKVFYKFSQWLRSR